MNARFEQIRSSMLWAAWADALGFISELTSEENLRRRTGGRPLTTPMPWSRIIGGRMGVRANLPRGCYSDDTQLRLATARSITARGFDVEAFARVELTVWPNYALGGGRATRAAAASMSKQQANWATNFFDGWENAGGNGAAMRIQPHVYAADDLGSMRHLVDVVKNTIVTHGHPRAIVGAVFHAVALSIALLDQRVPGPRQWSSVLEITRSGIHAFAESSELALYWVPQWERKTSSSFEAAWHRTVDEIEELLRAAELAMPAGSRLDRSRAADAYEALVAALSLDEDRTRGSGTNTTVAALALAAAFPDHPAQSAQLAAGRLNTDTDTIATMAAAIVGAAAPRDLMSPVQDADYLEYEASRLAAIADGAKLPGFAYPDLLHWSPPKSALEATGLIDGELALAGLGLLTPVAPPHENRDAVWRWSRTDFGQTLLVKHRHDLRELPTARHPARRSLQDRDVQYKISFVSQPEPPQAVHTIVQPTLLDVEDHETPVGRRSIIALLEELAMSGYKDSDIGHTFKELVASRPQDVELFTIELAKRLQRE